MSGMVEVDVTNMDEDMAWVSLGDDQHILNLQQPGNVAGGHFWMDTAVGTSEMARTEVVALRDALNVMLERTEAPRYKVWTEADVEAGMRYRCKWGTRMVVETQDGSMQSFDVEHGEPGAVDAEDICDWLNRPGTEVLVDGDWVKSTEVPT